MAEVVPWDYLANLQARLYAWRRQAAK